MICPNFKNDGHNQIEGWLKIRKSKKKLETGWKNNNKQGGKVRF